MVYSVKLAAIEMELIGTAVFTVSVTTCVVEEPTAVEGNVALATVNTGPVAQACCNATSKATIANTAGQTVRRMERRMMGEENRRPSIEPLLNLDEPIAGKSTNRLMASGRGEIC
jgi:hypothetical protein